LSKVGHKQAAHALGKSGEDIALNYLKDNKYKIIARSYRLFKGEIDIIASDQKTLVFVEVKTRKSKDYGFPEESVTPSKQRQIRKIAQGFLAKNNLQDMECRFDVISLSFDENEGYSVRHIKNAF
jgi:putative endonuclease